MGQEERLRRLRHRFDEYRRQSRRCSDRATVVDYGQDCLLGLDTASARVIRLMVAHLLSHSARIVPLRSTSQRGGYATVQ